MLKATKKKVLPVLSMVLCLAIVFCGSAFAAEGSTDEEIFYVTADDTIEITHEQYRVQQEYAEESMARNTHVVTLHAKKASTTSIKVTVTNSQILDPIDSVTVFVSYHDPEFDIWQNSLQHELGPLVLSNSKIFATNCKFDEATVYAIYVEDGESITLGATIEV